MSESVALNTRAVPGLGSQSVVADVRIPRGIVDIDRACECFVAQGEGNLGTHGYPISMNGNCECPVCPSFPSF